MGRVVNVLVHDHDPLYVALAAFVCIVGCAATLNVLDRAKLASGRVRAARLCADAAAGGVAVWATHFVAMLGFHSHLSASYDIMLMVISAVVAVIVLGIGFSLPFWAGMRRAVVLPSGSLVGLGIGAMHYLGMAAYKIDLIVTWDVPLVVASLGLGADFAAWAMDIAMREGKCSRSRCAGATALLVVAIVALHFTAMAALEVPPHDHSAGELGGDSAGWLAGSVALASILLASRGLLSAGFDHRIAVSRTRFLAAIEAMQDGFVLYDADDRLVMCNEAFRSMHAPARQMIEPGRTFEDITRAAAAVGYWADAVGREAAWIAKRVACRRGGGS